MTPTPQAVEEALAWADSTKAASENAHHARVLALALRESRSENAALKARISEFDKSIMSESRDPNGTIWEAANRFLARAEAAEARVKEAMAAGYAQGVEVTEARASKRIAELEADYERVQKLSSDAGSRGHELLKEVTWLKSRMAEIHKKWEAAESRLAEVIPVVEAAKKARAGGPYTPMFAALDALPAPSTQEKPQ